MYRFSFSSSVNRTGALPPISNVIERCNGSHRLGVGHGKTFENRQFFLRAGIADVDLHQEAIHLRDRQCIGALGIERIHRRHDDEGIRKRVRLRADRHLALLHRFEQRRLDFSRCAIDFVGKHDVAEDRSQDGGERALALVEDTRADDVAR